MPTEAGKRYVSAIANAWRRISRVLSGSRMESICPPGSMVEKRMNDNITQSIRESYDRVADEYAVRIFPSFSTSHLTANYSIASPVT